MTYKLNAEVSKIKSPVILRIEGRESSTDKIYGDGAELANATFEENYVMRSLTAKGDVIVLTVSENPLTNNTNWIGEEMTECGFF